MVITRNKKVKVRKETVAFTLRMPKEMCDKLDKILSKKPWINRSGWIFDVIADKIGEEWR